MASSKEATTNISQVKFLQSPLSFEANFGQVDSHVKFLSRGPGYGLFLTATEAILVVQSPRATPKTDRIVLRPDDPLSLAKEAALRLQFVGPKVRTSRPMGHDKLPGQSHYFFGNEPTGWRTHIPHYSHVVYQNIYPGIDLIYYGHGGQLEYDLVVAPGADPKDISLQFQGAESITLTPNGHLRLGTSMGEVLQHQPIIYQEKNGVKHMISGSYRLRKGNLVTFDIQDYDSTRPLYIDPVLSYSSYFESEGVYSLDLDAEGNMYLTGATVPSFPTVNAVQRSHEGYLDAFVTKLDPTGSTLIYSTFLGGSLDDQGRDIAVDDEGNAYVVGISSSADFPTSSPFQFDNAGSYDIFLAMLNPTGSSLVYSTYLGGSGEDGLIRGLAIALDGQGNAYLTGTTNSSDFPTVNPLQPNYKGAVDAFVTKVNSTGSALLYSTFLGGTNSDYGGDIAVDGLGNAYVVGTTFSADFPTVNPLQANPGGERDIFISKLTPDGLALSYSTYLGGNAQDEGSGLALGTGGQVYITGHTQSVNYPLVNPAQSKLAGSFDVVISKLNAAGTSLLFSTYVGGTGQDKGVGIAADSSGNAYVTGSTASENFPVTSNAVQTFPGMSGFDAFVLKLQSSGASLIYASYLGGDADDEGRAIKVNGTQEAYVVGKTSSSDIPQTAPFQTTQSGGFVAKIIETSPPPLADLTITMADSPDPLETGNLLTYTIGVSNNGPDSATGVWVTDTLPARIRLKSVSASQGTCRSDPVVCQLGTLASGSSATVTISGTPLAAPFTMKNSANAFSDLPDPTVSDNRMKITTQVTAPDQGPRADLTLVKNDSSDPVTIGAPFRYTLTITNNGPDTATDVILTDTLPTHVSFGSAIPSQGTCTGNRKLTCSLGSMKNGSGATVTIDVIPTTVAPLSSQALVTSSAGDPNPDNNSDTEATLVNVISQASGSADLQLTLSDEEDPVETRNTGEAIVTWNVTVFNGGPDTASDVMLRSSIPAATIEKFRGVDPSQGECVTEIDECTGQDCLDILTDPLVVTCDIGTLPLAAKFTTPISAELPPGTHTNTVSVTSSTSDPVPQNNSAVESTTVVMAPEKPQQNTGGGDGGGGCFIATAAYGSPLAQEVQILRHFRDQFLLPSLAGRLLVRGYYLSSPPVATLIEQHHGLKKVVRGALWPVVWWAHLTLNAPHLALMVFLGGLIITMSLLYWVILFWQRRTSWYLWGGRQ